MTVAVTVFETLGRLETEGALQLRAAGIDKPRHEARLLLQHAAGLSKEALIAHPSQTVSHDAVREFRAFIRRRSDREPVAYILGAREFWSLEFKVSPSVLIPRPDSETLIEAALSRVPDRTAPLHVLDLGTGTGCLVLAMLSELPNARGLGLDVSAAALAVAEENARTLGFSGRAAFMQAGWADCPAGAFDVVLSNPPYIAEPDLHLLERDVRDYEPHLALSGGPDGLDAYRAILGLLACVLAPHGTAVVELGAGQYDAVSALAAGKGLSVISAVCDLAGCPRCLVLGRGTEKN